MNVQKLHPDALLPIRSEGSVGYDLFADASYDLNARSQVLVCTGIALTIPEGQYGRVAPRSGLSVKHGLNIGAGVIDPDYTGEIKVLLQNPTTHDFHVARGTRIAQLIIEKCATPEIVEVTTLDHSATRGEKGFGSSGMM